MSFTKRAYFAGERDGELLVQHIVPGEQVKTAGALCEGSRAFIDGLRPDPRYTYVLTNAMGYSQFFGANSNTDWYGYNEHLNFDGLLNSWPDIGQNVDTDAMKGKAWPYGYPCFYGATVFAHHKNKDPQRLGFGDVVFAGVNSAMKRVELVERVHNEEAIKRGHTSILHRIRAGERVDVSMGCRVPFDLCSICTDWDAVKRAWATYNPKVHRHPGIAILAYHRKVAPIRGLAVTKVDYCQHMVSMRGKILPDGRKVFVFNDFPRFFDISFVWIGADRTARVMWHMSEGELPAREASPSLAGGGALAAMLRKILASRGKVASIEKEVPGGLAQAVHSDAATMPNITSPVLQAISTNPTPALSSLAALGIVLKPCEFAEMALGGALHGKEVPFNLSMEGTDDTYAVDPSRVDSEMVGIFSNMVGARSAFAPFLNARLLAQSGQKLSSYKDPKPMQGPLMDKIAKQYNGYRLSVLEKSAGVFGQAGSWLPDMVPTLKKASDPLEVVPAGVLLSPGPMVHFTSSHFPQANDVGSPINTVANYAAAENSYTRLLTIGVALRAAMEVGHAGGLVQAAKKVVTVLRNIL